MYFCIEKSRGPERLPDPGARGANQYERICTVFFSDSFMMALMLMYLPALKAVIARSCEISIPPGTHKKVVFLWPIRKVFIF